MQLFSDVASEVALILALGALVLVAVGGWSGTVLPRDGEKAEKGDLLVRLFGGAVYTVAAVAALLVLGR